MVNGAAQEHFDGAADYGARVHDADRRGYSVHAAADGPGDMVGFHADDDILVGSRLQNGARPEIDIDVRGHDGFDLDDRCRAAETAMVFGHVG